MPKKYYKADVARCFRGFGASSSTLLVRGNWKLRWFFLNMFLTFYGGYKLDNFYPVVFAMKSLI
jgi:hypothetical protein